MNDDELQSLLSLAGQKRQSQQWFEAVQLYRQLEDSLRGNAAFHHNLALCLFGANQPEAALVQADVALDLQASLWQSAVVKVRALSALGRSPDAAKLLQTLHCCHPEQAEFSLELATIALHDECDARDARCLVKPFLTSPAHSADASLTDLMASQYDRDESAQSLNERVKQFARTHLDRSQSVVSTQIHPGKRTRLRIGLLSPQFNCSPVFFFCIGALRLLAQEFDLYFFHRGHHVDWATEQLRSLSSQWFDVVSLSADQLDPFLRQHTLDVLVDLGGWMDPIALKAISTKPAARMYKWVGGQSITTGLCAFDGFITDEQQTPVGYEAWFTEPLVRLPKGYVTYTPPPYMPAPVVNNADGHVLGIIANPVKVSKAFLSQLNATLLSSAATPVQLRFIDKRYQCDKLKNRILSALQPAQIEMGQQLSVQFISPNDHPSYLGAVRQLSEMIDTFPYTGGLTTMEALTLGVACSGQEGTLFCERHTHAHLHYMRQPGRPRSNHAALANSLSHLFKHGTLGEVAV